MPINPLPAKPFYFIRHGETEWNRLDRYMGQQDIPLNGTGLAQAKEMQPVVQTLNVQTICVSPLQRARKTADIINQGWGKNLKIVDELKEVSWGSHEGKLRSDGDGKLFQQWLDGELHTTGAETWLEFVERVRVALYKALQHPEPVLIVAHGGVFYSLQIILGLSPDFTLSNCELMHIQHHKGMWHATPYRPE